MTDIEVNIPGWELEAEDENSSIWTSPCGRYELYIGENESDKDVEFSIHDKLG
jgi:hypothetical protein